MLQQDQKKAPITGFLVVPKLDDAVAYYHRVFGAKETERYQDRRGKVWYAILHMFDIPLQVMESFPSMGLFAPTLQRNGATDANLLMVNVPDVETSFKVALKVGAVPIVDPQFDVVDGVRHADFRDPFGHRWQVRLGRTAAIQPALVVANLAEAVKFHVDVFGAAESGRAFHPIDRVTRSMVKHVGGSVHLLEPLARLALAPIPPGVAMRDSSMVGVTVANVDDTFAEALKAGAKPVIHPHDAYWGGRYAEFRLPSLQRVSACGETALADAVSNPAEMEKRFERFLKDNDNPLSPDEVLGEKVMGDVP